MISYIKHIFFKNGLFKQHFLVQKICLSQNVCPFKKAILYPSRQDSSREECFFSFGGSRYCFLECRIIVLGNSCMPQIQHFLKKCWHSFKQTCFISTSVLYIQASVFPGTCPYKVGSELCSNYVRFDVLIWGIIPHDDVIFKI